MREDVLDDPPTHAGTPAASGMADDGVRVMEAALVAVATATVLTVRYVAVGAVRGAWIARALPVGVLLVFGVAALVVSVPTISDEGVRKGVATAAAGVLFVVAGVLLRRKLFVRTDEAVQG